MMAVDDEWLRIGSANINNRSMGVDTECDLAIEAGGRADIAHAIRRFRNKLLAEHLGVTQEEVERETTARGSIAGAVESAPETRAHAEAAGSRAYSDITLSLAEMTDPEQAVGLDKLKALFSFGAEFHSVPRPVRKALPYVVLAGAAVPAMALHPAAEACCASAEGNQHDFNGNGYRSHGTRSKKVGGRVFVRHAPMASF